MSRSSRGLTVTVHCPHILTPADLAANRCDAEEVGEACDREIEVPTEVEGGEWEGHDADGRRGYWIKPYLTADPATARCPYHTELTPAEMATLADDVKWKCEDWTPMTREDARDQAEED